MKDTLSDVVEGLLVLPFRRSHVVGLVTNPQSWKTWFLKRNQNAGEEYQKRIDEAIMSLEWLVAQPKDSIEWIYNHPDDLDASRIELIGLVKGERRSDSALQQYALDMLSLAQQMKE